MRNLWLLFAALCGACGRDAPQVLLRHDSTIAEPPGARLHVGEVWAGTQVTRDIRVRFGQPGEDYVLRNVMMSCACAAATIGRVASRTRHGVGGFQLEGGQEYDIRLVWNIDAGQRGLQSIVFDALIVGQERMTDFVINVWAEVLSVESRELDLGTVRPGALKEWGLDVGTGNSDSVVCLERSVHGSVVTSAITRGPNLRGLLVVGDRVGPQSVDLDGHVWDRGSWFTPQNPRRLRVRLRWAVEK